MNHRMAILGEEWFPVLELVDADDEIADGYPTHDIDQALIDRYEAARIEFCAVQAILARIYGTHPCCQ